jgi:hypothetical protein
MTAEIQITLAASFAKRRMKMTIKEALQATIVGVLFASPFIVEIIKELLK